MYKLDTRDFSKAAYDGLNTLKNTIRPQDRGKASGTVQSLSDYISTWGLHRLCGDGVKYVQYGSPETQYKGHVYQQFLITLHNLTEETFNVNDPSTLINMENLEAYTGLNRLAIQLAREWSFWSVAVLGRPTVE